jgi:hypothetical protein
VAERADDCWQREHRDAEERGTQRHETLTPRAAERRAAIERVENGRRTSREIEQDGLQRDEDERNDADARTSAGLR